MNINLTGPYNSLGYGIACKNILKNLVKAGHEISFWNLGQPQPEKQEEVEPLQKIIWNQNFYDRNAPSIRIWHQHDLAHHVGKGLHVGFPFFELNKFNQREYHHLKSQDLILVSSEWAKSIVETEVPGVAVKVVPLGVDRSIFYDTIPEKGGPTVFLNIGKWEIRKGHDILVDIFNSAFEPDDDVELWLMPHNPFLNEQQTAEWIKLYKNSKLGDKIRILPRLQTQEEVATLMRGADCGIFPARAEGWNLEALEMMSCGKYIISTNYAAHTEFMNFDNSLLVNVNELEDAYDGIWFNGQGQWASFDEMQFDNFVTHMRLVHNGKQDGLDMKNSPGIETAKQFSWENSVNKLIESIL